MAKLFLKLFGVVLFAQIYAQDLTNYCRDQDVRNGLLPHPDPAMCQLFFVCAIFNTIPSQCPPDTIFVPFLAADPPDGNCEPGYPSTCQLTSTTTTTTTTTTTPPPTTTTTQGIATDPPTTTQGIGTQPTTTQGIATTPSTTTQGIGTTQAPGLPDDICDGRFLDVIPYPNICYRYIICIGERPHIGECEPRQIFHQQWHICIRGNRDTCTFCVFC